LLSLSVWRENKSAGEIAGQFNISFGAIWQHLGILRRAKVVRVEKKLAPFALFFEPQSRANLRDLRIARKRPPTIKGDSEFKCSYSMPNNIDVRAFSSKRDYERVVDYFLNADDQFLAGMGVRRNKLPPRKAWVDRIAADLELDDREKQSFFVAWLYNGEAVGHSNINSIKFGHQAHMHLHIWKPELRRSGLGVEFLTKSIDIYFARFLLSKLICEPWSQNAAPNRCLGKAGFRFVRCYTTIPSPINIELQANRYELTAEMWKNHLASIRKRSR